MPSKLSIIIPVYNEEENIPLIINEFKKYINEYNFEVIFAADIGSSEKTKELIKEYSDKYNFIKHVISKAKGYGASINEGLKKSNSDFICWTHADLQTDPFDAIKAFEIIKNEKNPEKIFVKGNRKNRHFFDKFFEFGMSIFESIILKAYLYDINAQPNLFHKSFLKLMKNPPEDFSLDLYVYYLAKSNNYKIKRFNVFFPERIHGESAWNTSLQSKFKFIKRTLDYSFKLKKNLEY